MRLTSICVVAAHLVSAAVDIKSIAHSSIGRAVPNSYIVELSKGSHFKRGFASPHEELYHDLKRRGAKWEVTKEYSGNLLTGAAVRLGSNADLAKLAEATGVNSIVPIYLHSPPKPIFYQVMQAAPNASASGGPLSTHVMSGVDKLHAEGYFGQGIKIGLIDTGIDYTHPALGGAIGPGNKVIGGYDFVGDAYTGLPDSLPIPDPDPLDQCNGHGTHVAGIFGANPNNPWNISGVAYQSQINAYRIFGCDGSVPDDVLINALLRAQADGNDVLNLSLGEPNGWTQSMSSVVASRIAREGRIVVVAAGNEGQFGAWYAASPATGLDVISVGSVDNTIVYQQKAAASNGREITYQALNPLAIPGNLQLYATSTDVNAVADACEPLPANTPDLSNRLVIIRRGTCTFATKLNNAVARGGRFFLVYNNVDGPLTAISTGQYPSALISQADGIFLVQQAIPQNLTISFPNSPSTNANPTGGLISTFSSYGPSYDMYLQPAITTPGGSIPSTWPVKMGTWALASGTSMASPFAAGAAALLLQVRGKNATTAQAARSIFQNTAIPIVRTINDSMTPAAARQGAGLLNVYDAIKNTGSLLPAELLLNDTAYLNDTHTLVVRNGGTTNITYTFTHVAAGTMNTITESQPNPGPLDLFNTSAVATITPAEITVPAGSSASANVTIRPPDGLDPAKFPVYSGYIRATGSDNSTLHSTYVGVAARLKDMKVIDNTNAYFGNVQLPVIVDTLGSPIPSNGSAIFSFIGTDFPIAIFRLLAGSPLFLCDLIDSGADLTSTNTPPKRSTWDWSLSTRAQAAANSLGTISQIPYLARNSAANTTAEGGYYSLRIYQFVNGSTIPDGSYRVRFRALKITGNPNLDDDYETWTGPKIVVKRGLL